ncbi:MAG TPA: holo-ACP synthase [Burkholderiaceae bacterium]|jgi:holo-[acyl-carrier protein] synthase|nr:holo-ACP synthase [Burkholderiaceae bacterium]
MIFGIGQDVIEIERVASALARHGERFSSRILGPRELAVYEARRRRWPQRGTVFLATRFAAKEAISKAVGLGMRQPMSWRSVEIVNEPGGRPCAVANGRFAAYLAERRLRLHVSVADLANLAVAQAVAETVDG